MFDRKKIVEDFADMIAEIDRYQNLYFNERKEKERDVKRLEASLSQCKGMIETLANALADAREAPNLVKDARIYLSILEGYVEPYKPSETYPNKNDLDKIEPYKSFREELKKQATKNAEYEKKKKGVRK
jgi:hypothetical protein